jgi:hypothetical protein
MNLELPQRKKPGKLNFNTDPAALSKWLNDLPLINTGKSLELIDSALEQINALSIPVKDRQQALELFTPAVMCVSDALKKKFLGKQLPLQDNNLLYATQALELCNKMATGYRILADDLNGMASEQPQLTIALHRALHYLSEILLTSYRIYVQYPAGLWKTINSLYAVADASKLAQQPVTDSTLKQAVPGSIETAYKQILLLALACPYRLRQGEIHLAYNTLINWAGASQLHRVGDENTHGLFSINLQSDDPPSYRALDHGNTNTTDTYILDTKNMSAQIRKNHTNNKENDIDTLQRLMLAWGDMPKRQFARHSQAAPVKLVIGLSTIHRLALDPSAEELEKDDNIRDKHYLQDPTLESTTNIRTDTTYGQSFKQRVAPDTNPLKGAYSADNPGPVHIESWKIADISAGGYCLLWDSDEASCAKVGELVALIEKDHVDPDKWQLGTIRRMKFTKNRGLELGVQLLSPGARAVWAHPCKEGVINGDKMQGILLPEIKAIKIEASLLLPSLPFRSGSMATVEDGDQTNSLSLTRQLENTGSFSQYHFTAVK